MATNFPFRLNLSRLWIYPSLKLDSFLNGSSNEWILNQKHTNLKIKMQPIKKRKLQLQLHQRKKEGQSSGSYDGLCDHSSSLHDNNQTYVVLRLYDCTIVRINSFQLNFLFSFLFSSLFLSFCG